MNPIRLSAQEAAFVYGEDQRIPLHLGFLAFLEAGPLRDANGAIDITRIRDGIRQRLHLLPIFRRKLTHVPLAQGRPVWVEDPGFDIEHHVHLTAVPRPGSRRQLLDLVGRLQAHVLDRGKPLWEIYFVDGLEDPETLAMVGKIHHSMVDGVSGLETASLLFDPPAGAPLVEAPVWETLPEPHAAALLFDAFVYRTGDSLRLARELIGAARDPRRPVAHAVRFARALDTLVRDFDRLPFNRPVGSRRAFAIASLPLDSVLEARRALGVTVNDVGLTALTGALRTYCAEHSIDPDALRRIKAICPVDNRAPGDTRPGSDVSSIIVDLPVDEPDLAARVKRVAEGTRRLKELDVADGANMWARVTSLLPVPLLRATSWLQFRGLMGRANLLVSNVRGPASPFHFLGARVNALHPYFGVQDGLGLNVVLFSYAGQLAISLAADPELVPELDAFAELVEKGIDELTAVV